MKACDLIPASDVPNQSPVFEGVNLFTSDPALGEAVRREGAGAFRAGLDELGARAGSAEVLGWGRRANENPPRLRAFDEKGRRLDVVEYHPDYHALMALSCAHGLHCASWEGLASGTPRQPGAVVARAAGFYLMGQAEAGHCCPITMTHASVPTLRMLAPDLASLWLPRITARDHDGALAPIAAKRAAKIGMGMTEKQGGTDVRANTTTATPSGADGAYLITGHKWFMSAPMSDAFFILAQAPGGLSCFFVPRVLEDGTLNALRFLRLKDKLGNRSNASSEVEFEGALGWLAGEEGRGVPAIIEMVTHTRLDCALGSAAMMRLGLAVATRHARHRTVFQKKLVDQPLMAQVLGDLALDSQAAMLLAMRLASSFERAETDEGEAAYRRLMTPVAKYWICQSAPGFLFEAMQCMGGNGYVEEGLLARAYREAPVNAIWEGSGNVICLDVLRAMQRSPETAQIVLAHLASEAAADETLLGAVGRLKALQASGVREADARHYVELLAMTAAGALMRHHAPQIMADAFVSSRLSGGFRYGYGAATGAHDARAIVDLACPPVG